MHEGHMAHMLISDEQCGHCHMTTIGGKGIDRCKVSTVLLAQTDMRKVHNAQLVVVITHNRAAAYHADCGNSRTPIIPTQRHFLHNTALAYVPELQLPLHTYASITATCIHQHYHYLAKLIRAAYLSTSD